MNRKQRTMNTPLPEKTCARCGRGFSWRKKWARDWDEVRYCSAACRRQKIGPRDQANETKILRALNTAPTSGIALETLASSVDQSEPLRQAARRLALEGRLQLVQSGRTIDPRALRGRVVIRRP